MMRLARLTNAISGCHSRNISFFACACQRSREHQNLNQVDGEFRTFEIPGLKSADDRRRRYRRRKEILPPRFRQMPTDQDWTSVWPTATSFKWSAVPLPIRQGVAEKITENDGVAPGKYANAELMKVPNFFHLTPKHIKQQCQAIKQFCTDWPKGLETKHQIMQHFPLTVTTSEYCFASPSLRDPRARMVTIQIPLFKLKLNKHARDKIIRLVGRRYDPKTDMLTIATDRCPVRKQNYDYAMYLLTALYFEAWKKEPWEKEKTEFDRKKYIWYKSESQKAVVSLLQRVKEIDQKQIDDSSKILSYLPDDVSETKVVKLKEVQEYKAAVEEIINQGEDDQSLMKYKNSVKNMLNIQSS